MKEISNQTDARAAAHSIRAMSERATLDGLKLKELIDEGRWLSSEQTVSNG